MQLNEQSDLEKYGELVRIPELREEERELVREMLERMERLSAENQRLRKALLRASSQGSRMSSKLKEALYE